MRLSSSLSNLSARLSLLRQCTHNSADHDVVTIFKPVVPGLGSSDPETPRLINDMVLPESGLGVERIWERERREADMVMLMSFGAKQRTGAEFKNLLNEADTRLRITKMMRWAFWRFILIDDKE